LGHAHVEERAGLLAAAHLEMALALVEANVGERPDRDSQGRIPALLGRADHHIGDADELLLHHAGLAGLGHDGILAPPALAGAATFRGRRGGPPGPRGLLAGLLLAWTAVPPLLAPRHTARPG